MLRNPSTVSDYDDQLRHKRFVETRPWHEWGPVRKSLGVVAMGGIIGASTFGEYWVHDVQPERERLALTQPEISLVYPTVNPDNDDVMVLDADGLGNLDSTQKVMSLPSLALIGNVYSVRYDEKGVDTAVVAAAASKVAAEAGAEQLFVVGHSMGGIVVTEVAEHMVADTGIELIGVALDSTPESLDAVRPEKRAQGELMSALMKWIPGSRESMRLRIVVEVSARSDQFLSPNFLADPTIDIEGLKRVIREVWIDKVLSKDRAGNGLIETQFNAITATGIGPNLAALSDVGDDGIQPPIFNFRVAYEADDNTILPNQTLSVLFGMSSDGEIDLVNIRMHGTGHANPQDAPIPYGQAITTIVVPRLQSDDAKRQSPDGSEQE